MSAVIFQHACIATVIKRKMMQLARCRLFIIQHFEFHVNGQIAFVWDYVSFILYKMHEQKKIYFVAFGKSEF